ncbi:MAG: DNA replication/repair protein RecF [Clostridia bacterium]|nr:DNA replication/repair protein RecF [Clostridia bacterium]
MRVLELTLKNFRNIENAVIVPSEEMNVVCGENAQGKTNLLESIWLFTGAKSFRGSKDSAFVKFGSESAFLQLKFLSEEIEKDASLLINEKRNAVLNENKLKCPSLLAGSFNAIVFSPNDLRLITDGPAVRRRFLDLALGQLYPTYIELLKNYLRAVTQRNKIIKDLKYDGTLGIMLDIYEKEIAENGRKIISFRKKYIELLNNFLPTIYSGLSSGKEILDTEYICCCPEEDLEKKLFDARREDMFSGVTSVGPHRDDIGFKINGIDARSFGSQGQKRSVALSLKLAEAEVIKKNVGEWPVCLLDDVMSELDPERQNFILNHIKEMQTFLSCCDPSNVKNLKAGKIFSVKAGSIT